MKTQFLLLAMVIALSTGCASNRSTSDTSASVDPYEGFNRSIFGFNTGVDTYFLKPVTQAYRFITPDFIEKRVSNFFSNLLEVRNIINAVLQGKGEKAANYTGRFIFNSTIGLGGLFDPAHGLGIEKTDGEDFGQTLGTWGVNSGPYLVLPLFGPSNIRDGFSMPVDMYADPVNYLEDNHARNGLTFLKLVDTRSSLLEAEKLLSGDRYVFVRDAYLQRRHYLVNDGEVEDTFGTSVKGEF
jgi:phospholipid-binding lipoprotein MlaA